MKCQHGFQNLQCVRIFFDDTTIAATTEEELLESLESYFQHTAAGKIHLQPSKCIFCPEKLPLIGRLIGPNSIEIDPARLGPLRDIRAPQSKKELHSFLGFAQYF